jgi:hypothetical protein
MEVINMNVKNDMIVKKRYDTQTSIYSYNVKKSQNYVY